MNVKNVSTGAPVPASRTFNLDDLQCDLTQLWELIDTAVDTLQNCDFGPRHNRTPHLDRINALLFIGLDKLSTVNAMVEQHYDSIGSTVSGKGAAQ